MQTAKFYGASDDLIEIEGVKGADEFGAYNSSSGNVVNATFILGAIAVYAIYGEGGTWAFAVGRIDEDVPLPNWPIRLRQGTEEESTYSVVLEIDVPDDVAVKRISETD